MNGQNLAYETQPAVRTSEVNEQMTRLQDVSETLDKLSMELETALERSILAQRKEVGLSPQTTPEPVRVPLAEALNSRINHLGSVRERLSSILSRLEA